MFLDTLLACSEFTPTSIQFPNADFAHKAFLFLRQAVLDRHIGIVKAIGVDFVHNAQNKLSIDNLVSIEGYSNCGESYPELMLNLQDKIFLTDMAKTSFTVDVNKGDIKITDVTFPGALVLHENDRFLRVLTNSMGVVVHVAYGNGYHSISRNSKIIPKGAFPFSADYTLAPFVKILPVRDMQTAIPVKYQHGMTHALFKGLLAQWAPVSTSNDFGAEELKWLQSFEQ